MPASFQDNYRRLVEDGLRRFFPDTGIAAIVYEAMAYSLFAGGKRIRPILTILAAEAMGGEGEMAMPAACAVEYLHTYSLIHDDLPAMDNDDLRRGLPTCHVKFGEDIAILAGDALIAEAFLLVSSDTRARPEITNRIVGELAAAVSAAGMVGGQAMDLGGCLNTPDDSENSEGESSGKARGRRVPVGTRRRRNAAGGRHTGFAAGAEYLDSLLSSDSRQPGSTDNVERIEKIHELKTGRLITAAARVGAIAAGADEAALTAITTYAAKVGLAFQVVDDILDITGSPASLGKNTGGDAGRDKVTFPVLIGINESKVYAERLIAGAKEALTAAHLIKPEPLFELADFAIRRQH